MNNKMIREIWVNKKSTEGDETSQPICPDFLGNDKKKDPEFRIS